MEGQIRLADRLGLLTGRVNPVQRTAAEIMLMIEDQKKYDDFVEQLKMTLLGSDPDRFYDVIFPQPPAVVPNALDEIEGPYTLEYEEAMSGEEAMRILSGLQPGLMPMGLDEIEGDLMPLDRGAQSDVQGGVTPLPPPPHMRTEQGKVVLSTDARPRSDAGDEIIQGFTSVVSNLRAANQEIQATVRDVQAARQREAMFGMGGGAAANSMYAWGMMRDRSMLGMGMGMASVPMRMGYAPMGDPVTAYAPTMPQPTQPSTPAPATSAPVSRVDRSLKRAKEERDVAIGASTVEARRAAHDDAKLKEVTSAIPGTAATTGEHQATVDKTATTQAPTPNQSPPPPQGTGKEGAAPSSSIPAALTPDERFERGLHYTKGSLYEDVGHTLQRRGSQLQGRGPNLTQNKDGEYIVASGPDAGRPATSKEITQHRNVEGLRQLAVTAGRKLSGASSLGEAFSGVFGAAEGAEGAGGAAGTIGSLASGLSPVLSVGGVALGAAALWRQGVQQITNQRNANAEWSQIYGGGTGILGPNTQRDIAAKAFTLEQYNPFSNAFGIGGGTLGKIYGGAASLGYRGSAFEGALDFGIGNFNKYGTSADDSLEMLQTSIESGNKSLTGLAKTLDDVAKSAEKSGQNVGEAQKKFSEAYSQVSQVFGGANAPAIAGGATTAATKLGATYNGVSFASLFSDTRNVQILGAMRGQTTGQVVATADTNPGSVGNTGGQLIAQRTQAGFRGDWQSVVAEYMKKRKITNGSTMTDAQIRELSTELEEGGYVPYPETIVNQLRGLGVNANVDNAVGIALQSQLNPNFIGDQIRKTQGPTQARIGQAGRKLATAPREAGGRNLTGGEMVEKQYMKTFAGDKSAQRAIKSLNLGGDVNVEQRRAYLESMRVTGVQSPLVEKLINSPQSSQLRFEVTDEEGKKRVVSLKDGLSKYYDQFVSGEAIEVAGPNKGASVASAVGMEDAAQSTKTKAAAEQAGKLENKSGRTDEMLSHWRAAHRGDENAKTAGGIKVTVEAKGRLAEMLKISTDQYDESRYDGTAVDPSNNPGTRKNG